MATPLPATPRSIHGEKTHPFPAIPLLRNPNHSTPTLRSFSLPIKRAVRSTPLLSISAKSDSLGSSAAVASEEDLASSLKGVEVFDLTGKAIPIVNLWRDRRAVVAFARHFGCVLCRKRADLLASKQEVMAAAGVALALIGPGTVDQAKAFSEQTKFKGDPNHSSYDALKFAYGVSTTFTPSAGLKIIQLYMEGYRQDWELSFKQNTVSKGGWQQGGILVAGPGVNNILYIHKDKEAGDDPNIEDVLKACSRGSSSYAQDLRKQLKPDAEILATVRRIYEESSSSSSANTSTHAPNNPDSANNGEAPKTLTLADLNLSSSCREVADLDSPSVLRAIERSILAVARSILSGRGFSFSVPSRSSSNQLFVPELDRIVLRSRSSSRPFAHLSTVRKATITARVLSLVHAVLLRGIHVTKRDLFYTDAKLFGDQSHSDAVLDDVSCMLGCTRSSLHVVASEKGVVVGRLVFSDDGDRIDCTRMGIGGKAIPPNIDRVSNLQSDALFVLLVEKDAAFMRLAEDRFYNRFPCIILTAKGQPDVATRLFLRKLKAELRLPVLALVDSDPYGLKILSVYMCGSKNMSYDSSNLTTPDIKWLGVRPSDLDKYRVPEQCRLAMTEQDVKAGRDLLEEDFVRRNAGWVRELETMLRARQKAEIQALSSFGFQYLTEVYLPLKLQQQDWL
uniref:DNA topoisomerase 6 subunit A n=1 Tax=Ananas comosus var. bracteatus TaxID=296719 RepID=A0A6V7QFP6_ANACO|nr:unnamed protein product [Ananas comosus var. bracteatus]